MCDDECLTLLKGLQLDAQVVMHLDLPGSKTKFLNCLCCITCNMWPWYHCSVWRWMPHTTEGSTVRRSGRYTLRPPRVQDEVRQPSLLYGRKLHKPFGTEGNCKFFTILKLIFVYSMDCFTVHETAGLQISILPGGTLHILIPKTMSCITYTKLIVPWLHFKLSGTLKYWKSKFSNYHERI